MEKRRKSSDHLIMELEFVIDQQLEVCGEASLSVAATCVIIVSCF